MHNRILTIRLLINKLDTMIPWASKNRLSRESSCKVALPLPLSYFYPLLVSYKVSYSKTIGSA